MDPCLVEIRRRKLGSTSNCRPHSQGAFVFVGHSVLEGANRRTTDVDGDLHTESC